MKQYEYVELYSQKSTSSGFLNQVKFYVPKFCFSAWIQQLYGALNRLALWKKLPIPPKRKSLIFMPGCNWNWKFITVLHKKFRFRSIFALKARAFLTILSIIAVCNVLPSGSGNELWFVAKTLNFSPRNFTAFYPGRKEIETKIFVLKSKPFPCSVHVNKWHCAL